MNRDGLDEAKSRRSCRSPISLSRVGLGAPLLPIPGGDRTCRARRASRSRTSQSSIGAFAYHIRASLDPALSLCFPLPLRHRVGPRQCHHLTSRRACGPHKVHRNTMAFPERDQGAFGSRSAELLADSVGNRGVGLSPRCQICSNVDTGSRPRARFSLTRNNTLRLASRGLGVLVHQWNGRAKPFGDNKPQA